MDNERERVGWAVEEAGSVEYIVDVCLDHDVVGLLEVGAANVIILIDFSENLQIFFIWFE